MSRDHNGKRACIFLYIYVLCYEMHLKQCGLTTLETTRQRGDQIEVFKILNGYENIDKTLFFSVKEERRTRGHGVTY